MKRPTQFLLEALAPARLTRIVDVGANPLGAPAYNMLLKLGACEVFGFEPDARAYDKLLDTLSDNEIYLPCAVGDGSEIALNVYRGRGLASTYPPYEGAFDYLGRSRKNMRREEVVNVQTRTLDELDEIGEFDLLKIDIQGGEVAVFRGAERKLTTAAAVITELRYYPIYVGEPMLGGVDLELRRQGYQLLKFLPPKVRMVPNSFSDRLNSRDVRSQLVDGDAVYLRDLAGVAGYTDEQLKHLAILASSIFIGYDLALYCLDRLVERGAIGPDVPAGYFATLPGHIKIEETVPDASA